MARLTSIALQDFRNYETLRLEPAAGTNLLLGANGQGKTNLLEAVYFLSLLRSFRTGQQRDLYRWRCSRFLLRGVLETTTGQLRLGVEYRPDRRQLRLAGEPVPRASDFINRLCCVALAPEDIALAKGSGGDRRRFLDISLSRLDDAYLAALQDYGKALKARNGLLRRSSPPPRELAAFADLLARHGALIMQRRRQFLAALGTEVTVLANDVWTPGQTLTARYEPAVAIAEDDDLTALHEALAQALAQSRERDIARQQTTSGPHRDDVSFAVDGRDLGRFGSEGQCRLAALVVKMATARFVHRQRCLTAADRGVVLLVDDVIGELDDRAREAFFGLLRDVDQVFVAGTDETLTEQLAPAAVFTVKEGTVTPRTGPPTESHELHTT